VDRAAPIAKAEMLIRRPVAEVFEAFVDPAVTSRFWFTRSTGRLEVGRRVRWDWEMYGRSGVQADSNATTTATSSTPRIFPAGRHRASDRRSCAPALRDHGPPPPAQPPATNLNPLR
jgi:hypothetical protein